MTRQESNNAQADIADLRGTRFVMTSETEEGQRLCEGKLKRITQGMGKIKAVRKYENPIQFPETHKLWMDANHPPIIRGTDNAIWNRLHPIPFDVTIPAEELDKQLRVKLLTEAEGIIAWAVAGAVRWHREGLDRPPEVEETKENWRSDMDQVGRFIQQRCVLEHFAHCRARELYGAYQKWVAEEAEQTSTKVMFGRKLTERGFRKRHTESGELYQGIGLKTEDS